MWIARDRNGILQISDMRMMKGENEFFPSSQSQVMYLNEDLFHEVTFENSPVEVELKLKQNGPRFNSL